MERFANEAESLLRDIGAGVKDEIAVRIDRDAAILEFEIIGPNKVDVAFHLEELARTRNFALLGFAPDVTTSRFIHKASPATEIASQIIALEQREILERIGTFSFYQTGTVAVASASAFVLAALAVLLIIYRKSIRLNYPTKSPITTDKRCLAYDKQPVYVISGSEKEDRKQQCSLNVEPKIESHGTDELLIA